MADESIIIDVRVDGLEVSGKLTEVTTRIKALKDANKEHSEKVKELSKDYGANAKEIATLNALMAKNNTEVKALNVSEQALQKQLLGGADAINAMGDSFAEQGRKLTELKKQYRALSEEQRNSDGGKKMLEELQKLDAQVKENDKSLGDFQRNVGNYPKVIDLTDTTIGKLSGTIKQFTGDATTAGSAASNAFNGIKASAISMGKAFLTPPVAVIAAVLSAIVLVVSKVSEAFKKNDEAGTRLQRAFATFQPLITGISKAFDALALYLSKVVEGMAAAVVGVTKFLEFLGLIPKGTEEAIQAAQDLVTAEDNLEERMRKNSVAEQERLNEISKLRDKVAQKDKYNAKEREEFLKQAIDLEEAIMREKQDIAEEELRILEEKAKQEVDTSDATADKIAAARVKVLKAEQEYYTGTRRMQDALTTARREQAAEEDSILKAQEAKRKEAIKRREEEQKALLDMMRMYESEMNKAIKDETERAIAERTTLYNTQVADLRSRLENDKTLTIEARKVLNDTLLQMEINKDADLKAIRDAASEAERQKEEQAAAERLSKDKERWAEEALKMQNEYEAKRQALEGNDAELMALRLEQARAEQQALTALTEEEVAKRYESTEQYNAAVLRSNANVASAQSAISAQANKDVEHRMQSIQAMNAAISGALTEIAGDNKAMLAFSKGIALANASLNLAQAISSATAEATKGDPYTIAVRIASAVAGVVVSFSQVFKSIKAAKEPSAPKFATGGVVQGNPSTGDSVNAWLTPHEVVLNSEQQAKLLYSLATGSNANGGMSVQALTEAFIAGAQAINVTMDYKEFTTFQHNTLKYNEYATI